MSLLARDPIIALRLGEARVTFVSLLGEERPSIQVVDPPPSNFVLNNGLEVMRFVESVRKSGIMPSTIACYNEADEVVGEFSVPHGIGRLVLNFTDLGSAAAAFILLLTGTPPSQINWDKVLPSQITSHSKAPDELGHFIRWHLLD